MPTKKPPTVPEDSRSATDNKQKARLSTEVLARLSMARYLICLVRRAVCGVTLQKANFISKEGEVARLLRTFSKGIRECYVYQYQGHHHIQQL